MSVLLPTLETPVTLNLSSGRACTSLSSGLHIPGFDNLQAQKTNKSETQIREEEFFLGLGTGQMSSDYSSNRRQRLQTRFESSLSAPTVVKAWPS